MGRFVITALSAIAVATYGLDAFAVSFVGIKLPVAALLTGFCLLVGFAVFFVRGAVMRPTFNRFLLWLLLLMAWTLACMSGQEVSDTAVRLLTYSACIIAAAWLYEMRGIEPVMVGFLVGASAVVAVGFYRFITASGGEPSEHLLGYWGIKYLPATRNGDALYPLIGLALALSYRRLVTLPLAVMFGTAIILSGSRGAWLVMAVLLLVSARSMRTALLAGTAAIAMPLLVVSVWPDLRDALLDRAATIASADDTASNQERLELLQAASAAFPENTLGAGVGNFGQAVGYRALSSDVLNHAENTLATVAIEQGLLGLLVYLVLYVGLTRNVFAPTRSFALLAAVALAHSVLNYELNSWFYWAVVGLGLSPAYPADLKHQNRKVRGTEVENAAALVLDHQPHGVRGNNVG